MVRLLVLLAVFFVPGLTMCATNIDSKRKVYSDLSTASAYIEVYIRNPTTGMSSNVVLENSTFAEFLAMQRGVPKSQLGSFVKTDYSEFMLRHEGRPIDVDLQALEQVLAARFGSRKAARDYLERQTFDSPFTLEQAGVTSEAELLERYFHFDPITGTGRVRPEENVEFSVNPYDPRFIVLLIRRGFVVRRGDVVPFLIISRTAGFD